MIVGLSVYFKVVGAADFSDWDYCDAECGTVALLPRIAELPDAFDIPSGVCWCV